MWYMRMVMKGQSEGSGCNLFSVIPHNLLEANKELWKAYPFVTDKCWDWN
jgi:hypothetical protein